MPPLNARARRPAACTCMAAGHAQRQGAADVTRTRCGPKFGLNAFEVLAFLSLARCS